MKKLFFTIFIVIQALTALIFTGCNNQEEKKEYNISVKNQDLLDFFKENNKNCNVIQVKEGDLNGDSTEDMIVIFKHRDESEHKEEFAFTVVLNNKSGLKVLDHYRAPVENQKIEFKEVDGKPPIEFIISGSKNGSVGYSIYRFQDNKVIDIFGGDNMDPC